MKFKYKTNFSNNLKIDQLISVANCKPTMSIIQDSLLGVSKFTQNSVEISRKMYMNIL